VTEILLFGAPCQHIVVSSSIFPGSHEVKLELHKRHLWALLRGQTTGGIT